MRNCKFIWDKTTLENMATEKGFKFITVRKYYNSSHDLRLTSPFEVPLRDPHHSGLRGHDLSKEGIKLWITYILFWPHKDMEGLTGWVISSMPEPPPRQHKHERQYTPSTQSVIPTRRIWNDDYDGQMILGDLRGLKFPDICLTGEEKPRRKISPRKPVPTGDRTRVRCVTNAHATTCSTAVDRKYYNTLSKNSLR